MLWASVCLGIGVRYVFSSGKYLPLILVSGTATKEITSWQISFRKTISMNEQKRLFVEKIQIEDDSAAAPTIRNNLMIQSSCKNGQSYCYLEPVSVLFRCFSLLGINSCLINDTFNELLSSLDTSMLGLKSFMAMKSDISSDTHTTINLYFDGPLFGNLENSKY